MKETTRNEIIRRWQAGMSMRAIARELGVSRDSVSRVLKGQREERGEQVASSKPSSAGASRRSSLDNYQEFLVNLLARYPNITAVRVHEELRKKGFRGGYTRYDMENGTCSGSWRSTCPVTSMESLGNGTKRRRAGSTVKEKGKTKGRTFRGRSRRFMGFEPADISERPSGPPG